jgi:nucleolar MIF4G domain-containing protein 1
VVGSAWQGSGPGAANSEEQKTALTENFSQKLLELARQQRMNTDVRKNIFCILMTAEVS